MVPDTINKYLFVQVHHFTPFRKIMDHRQTETLDGCN